MKQASVAPLPFDDAIFDAIATINTLYFWPDFTQGIAECHQVLKLFGVVVLGCNIPKCLEQ